MPSRVKCKECLGCMIARWVNNSRYYYCDLCRIWYGGRSGELVVVENPYADKINPEKKEETNE